MKLHVDLKENSYDIFLERGILHHITDYINLQRKVCIITDENVPDAYAQSIQAQCAQGYIYTIPSGENSKSLHMFEKICNFMLEHNFSRKDCIIAVGGGVCGDLSGYVAASYMRGIDFYQVPTTTLSQIDSSIGGKVAINLSEVKNIIGAFYQPRAVFIDFDTLTTLDRRHFYNGLVEALKAGLIYDESLFHLFEQDCIEDHLEEIIYRALCVKKDVVEKDPKEQGLRKILNFGHTIGHAIESYYHLDTYLHGECVAMGMLYFIEDETLKQRVQSIYKKLMIPETPSYDRQKVYQLLTKDKKASGSSITVVKVTSIGHAILDDVSLESLQSLL